MFNHKKFLAALLCTPLFTACVIGGDDEDDVGDSSTDPTANTLTTTAGTDDSSGTLTTTVGTEESGSGTVADSGSSDEGSTGEPTGGNSCFPACTEAADCCNPADPTCADNLGTYPNNFTCEGGVCANLGCTDDAECEAVIPGTVCSQIEGFGGVCETPCETEAECTVPGFDACLDDGEGGLTCQPGPCTDSADCGVEGAICEADGTCTYPGCEDDADCFTSGVCDVATGSCGCADDTECMEGFVCAE